MTMGLATFLRNCHRTKATRALMGAAARSRVTTHHNSDLMWQRFSEVQRERLLALRGGGNRDPTGETRDRLTPMSRGMNGVTSMDLALLWLERLGLQAPSYGMRENRQHRAEHLLDELFFELVTLARPALFIEVGAHDGQRAVRAKAENPHTRVIALEGNPRHYEAFKAATDSTPTASNTFIWPRRCSRSGDLPRAAGRARRPTCRRSLLPRSGHAATLTTVPASFNSFLADAGSVALWVDVEGARRSVLAGATDMLQRVDVIKLEVEEWPFWESQWLAPEVLAALLDVGLVPVELNRVFNERQYDLLLVSQRLMGGADVGDLVMRFLGQVRAPASPTHTLESRCDHPTAHTAEPPPMTRPTCRRREEGVA